MLILISYVLFLDGKIDVYVLLAESSRPLGHGKFRLLTVSCTLGEILKHEEVLAYNKKYIYA
jgi:hypothetical protein